MVLHTWRTRLFPQDYHALKWKKKKKVAGEWEQQTCACVPVSNLVLGVLTQEEPPTISAQTALCISTLSPRFSLSPSLHWSSLANSASRSPHLSLCYFTPAHFYSSHPSYSSSLLAQISSHLGFLTHIYSSHTQIRAHEHLPLSPRATLLYLILANRSLALPDLPSRLLH